MVENRYQHLYTGITTDIKRRLRQHNGELKGGAKALKGKGPVQLRWLASTLGKSQALKTEYQLKRLSRQQKNALITQGNQPLKAPFENTLVCTSTDQVLPLAVVTLS
ncbi:GIY-YIG nuclease family protein [Alteromonas sp. C1M14]|nr:GIY-YIG nuclease family protein [Alteromonas sp. C1M14]MBU2979224.1 GIY-YIG nuclease family protein [Alteromonas sp. C1M14]